MRVGREQFSAPGYPVPSLILVVDEDPQIHQVVGRWLEDAGYECINALTPRDARDILRAGAAPTVVILADHFREESGLSFAGRLIQRGRDLGFLFLSHVWLGVRPRRPTAWTAGADPREAAVPTKPDSSGG